MVQMSLKLSQKTIMSQVQRLTIRLMGLHGSEMQEFLQEQVTNNPLLDIRYKDVRIHTASQENEQHIQQVRARADSWEEQLMQQLRFQRAPKEEILAAGVIVQHLDERGFFTDDEAELGEYYHLSPAVMKKGLALVQQLDPAGIGARSTRECLLLQACRCADVPHGARQILIAYYDAFLHGRWQYIKEQLNLTNQGLKQVRDFLKTLSLQPVVSLNEQEEYIRPDIELYGDEKGMLHVRSLEELPEVFFRQDLYMMYSKQGDEEAKRFIHKAKRQFLDLQSALAYRWHSIFTVMTYIAAYQKSYFLEQQMLRPLLQQDVARETGLSTATVSRVCRDRYILFGTRVLPMQSFFARSYQYSDDGQISDKAIMTELMSIIQEENKAHPLSDQHIADLFQKKEITISRRTITKFRLQMHIPNSTMRKRIHMLNEG